MNLDRRGSASSANQRRPEPSQQSTNRLRGFDSVDVFSMLIPIPNIASRSDRKDRSVQKIWEQQSSLLPSSRQTAATLITRQRPSRLPHPPQRGDHHRSADKGKTRRGRLRRPPPFFNGVVARASRPVEGVELRLECCLAVYVIDCSCIRAFSNCVLLIRR